MIEFWRNYLSKYHLFKFKNKSLLDLKYFWWASINSIAQLFSVFVKKAQFLKWHTRFIHRLPTSPPLAPFLHPPSPFRLCFPVSSHYSVLKDALSVTGCELCLSVPFLIYTIWFLSSRTTIFLTLSDMYSLCLASFVLQNIYEMCPRCFVCQ